MAEYETFASGFAKSFIAANEARKQREADEENLQFKYKMDALMQMRERREKKKAVEDEYAAQAKSLASYAGDDNFGPVALQELKLGVSAETIQKRWADGDYAKNGNFVAPSQTVKVPRAVTEPTQFTRYDEGMDDESTPSAARRAQRINKKIDSIDETLRYGDVTDEDTMTAANESGGGAYVFKPKNQIKIGDLADSRWRLYQARQSKDPVAIRDAEEQVKINERIETERSIARQREAGKNTSMYLSVNEDGSINSQLPGEIKEDGHLYNTNDPNNPQLVSGMVIPLDDLDRKRLNELTDTFGKEAKDYNVASESFVGALDSSQKMAQILHDDPDAATYSSKGLEVIQNLTGEAQAAYTAITDMESKINEKVNSGKIDGIEKDMADHYEAVNKFVNTSILTSGNQQKALNAAKFKALQMQTAYQIAQATSTDGKVSNQDLANSLEIIGGTSHGPTIVAKLNQQMQGAFLKLSSKQQQLNSNFAVNDFEQKHKLPNGKTLQTGLRGKRIGDQIMAMDIAPEQKQLLMSYLSTINGTVKQGTTEAVASAQQGASQPEQQKEFQPDEFGMIPGTIYPGKSGKKYRYKGGGKDPKNFEEVK